MIWGWLKRLFGLASEVDGSVDEPDDTDFSQYSLYEIGDRLCRHYDDGIGSERRATHFGEYSMSRVLADAYEGVSLEPDHVRLLDRLTEHAELTSMQAKASGGIDPKKVETFREEFFDLFSPDEIEGVLSDLYVETYDEMLVFDELVRPETVDGCEFRYQITDPRPAQIAMENESMGMRATNFTEKSVPMKAVGAQVHLAKSNVTDTIEDMVEGEARLFWQQVDVANGAGDLDDDDFDSVAESMLESIRQIRESYGDPDTIVTDEDFEWDDRIHGCTIVTDETGTMDVPFVIADSDHLGYRVSESPVETVRPDTTEAPLIYRVQWNGNYAITDQDAIAGPG